MKAASTGPRPAQAALVLAALAFLHFFAPPAAAQTGTPAAAGAPPAVATEASVRELKARIEELERHLGASALLDLIARIDRLAKEIQMLRDRTEIQAHSLESFQGRQQDLYAELDRLAHRLAQPASGVAGAPPNEVEAPGPAAEPGADSSTVAVDSTSPGEPGEPGTGTPEGASPGAAEPGAGGEGSGTTPRSESLPQYDPVEEQDRYQLAFDLLSEGRFERAANAFTQFLAAYPDSRYRDTARFWKGECLYALRRFEPALREFRVLVDDHPDSTRIPGARLKIGFILHELDRTEEASEVLRALVESAPDTSEAKLARDRLERLP